MKTPRHTVKNYLDEKIIYCNDIMTRGELIASLQNDGCPRGFIDMVMFRTPEATEEDIIRLETQRNLLWQKLAEMENAAALVPALVAR